MNRLLHALAAACAGAASLALSCAAAPAQDAAPAPEPEAAAPQRSSSRAPAGMVPYDKPVYRNGRRVLYRGAWRDKGAGRSSVAPAAAATAPRAQAAMRLKVSIDPRLGEELERVMKRRGAPIELAASSAADIFVAAAPLEGAKAESGVMALARLYECPVAIVGRAPAETLADLAGKPVAVDPAGSLAGDVARMAFQTAGVAAQFIDSSAEEAPKLLARGEVAAYVVVGPNPRFANPPADARLVAAPWSGAARARFLPFEFQKDQYPRLVGARARVDSLAVPTVLAMRPKDDPAQKAATEKFVDAFFSALGAGALKAEAWRDVNIDAQTPYARLDYARDWIDKRRAN